MSQGQSTVHSPPTHDSTRLAYMPSLDGMRAIAVIAVLLYHAGLPVPGGFLGVESFFVLSGFLITLLLLGEWTHTNQIDLRTFWMRRARRLLPALFCMLAGVAIITALVLRGEHPGLGADMLASLAYVMNWHLIVGGQSYFDPLVRPSLLQHLWSLAIEEQFYLLWPLIFVVGMRVLRQTGLRIVILAVALGSMALMARLYRPGVDPSRIYYGTDTRAAGLLIGAALALVWTPLRTACSRSQTWLFDSVGVLALAGLIASFVWIPSWHPLLYRGGFTLIDIFTALLIITASHPRARLVPRILGWQPLRWIGLRSYGLYLWHWPIFMVTRPYLDLPLAGLPLLVLRLAIVGILVDLSYRWIELPVRGGALGRIWQRWRSSPGAGQTAWLMRSSGSTSIIRWLCLLIPILLLVGSASFGNSDAPIAAERRSAVKPPQVATPIPARREITATATPTASASSGGTMQVATPIPAAPAPPTATPSPTIPQPLDPALIAQLQAVLDDAAASRAIPGAVVSVSIPGYVPWSGASGVADYDDGRPMQPDTLIHISSITKMFTAVVVLQLAEEGRLDLDAPISTVLPDIVPLAERTTARHLLGHTSGIFDYLEDSRFFIEAYQNPERTYTPDELVGMVDSFGAAFEPGSEGAWKYSSTNYVILGMLIEQITGRPLAEEMRQRIFAPLGLTHTFFAPYEQIQGRLAQGYIDSSDRADVSMTFVFATGNIISTADDLRHFVDRLFGGGLLKAESLAMMTTTVDTGGAYEMPELQYGLGLMRAQLNVSAGPNGEQRPDEYSTVLGHIGGIAGFRTAVWHVPESGITISLGLNQANIDPNLLARDTLDVILTWQGQ